MALARARWAFDIAGVPCQDMGDHEVTELLALLRLLVDLPCVLGQLGTLRRLQFQLASGLEGFVEFLQCVNWLFGVDWSL